MAQGKLPFSLLLFCVMLCVIYSCTSDNARFTEQQKIDEKGWAMDESKHFEMLVNDTSEYLDFQLLIDNKTTYKYANLYLFVDMQFPNERWLKDTIECYLSAPSGRWLGENNGDTYHNEILYKYKRKMPLPGSYKVDISHGMRDSTLTGIESVGIQIKLSP